MTNFTLPVRFLLYLLVTTYYAIATPAGGSPACGGNLCYPVLVGPTLKSIASDYCSYFLQYPRTTTVTVKSTSTSIKQYTLPTSTVSVISTTQKSVPATVTSTATVPGQVITSTVTETSTVNAMKKRDPSPLYTPPKGSGPGYKLPLLAPYSPAAISAACSCVVTPTTVTVTSTSKVCTTSTQTITPPASTKTVGTITKTVTVTTTEQTTVTGDPSTTTTTETTTKTAEPAQTCNGVPGTPQRQATGFLQPNAQKYPPRQLTPSQIESAEGCYNACRDFVSPYPDRPSTIRSYSYTAGACVCYNSQICLVLENNPAGDTIGGDIALPF